MIEADAHVLAERLRRDFPDPPEPSDWVWTQAPAVRVIDCVLSLRKPYATVVLPRVQGFAERFPAVTGCAQLRELIESYESPSHFHSDALRMQSPKKAAMLVGVLDYLLDVTSRFEGGSELERLEAWAKWVRPGDHLMLDVDGFKLAGFQYLRMLFGAETVKPDVHILRYVESALGRPIAGKPSREVQAVYAMERAGELLDRSVRALDVAIWSELAIKNRSFLTDLD